MQAQEELTNPETDYSKKFKSTFYGVLYWPDLDDLWRTLKSQTSSGWYIYDLNGPPPDATVSQSELTAFMEHMDSWLRETHGEDYCGVVYADDMINPTYVKVFHPKRMGYGVCSISKECPLPGWIISKLKPVELNPKQPERSRWWSDLPFFARKSNADI